MCFTLASVNVSDGRLDTISPKTLQRDSLAMTSTSRTIVSDLD